VNEEDAAGSRFRAIVESWVDDPDLEGDLIHVEHIPARQPIYATLDQPLHPLLAARLAEKGITELYRHQVRAIESVRAGKHTVVVAGTASGKTLTYLIPIVESHLTPERAPQTQGSRRPPGAPGTLGTGRPLAKSTALLLFPTKALAHDQLRRFTDLGIPEVVADAYDGDTANDERARIRRRANVILTNPDMLHVGILGSHERWADFFHRLSYVVVDEMHTLRGIFGTHVAMILRRLRRIAAHYGADPTFVLGSATIGNPGELGRHSPDSRSRSSTRTPPPPAPAPSPCGTRPSSRRTPTGGARRSARPPTCSSTSSSATSAQSSSLAAARPPSCCSALPKNDCRPPPGTGSPPTGAATCRNSGGPSKPGCSPDN
jgi:ATP-dependent helicase YprA (DUF1998 family)